MLLAEYQDEFMYRAVNQDEPLIHQFYLESPLFHPVVRILREFLQHGIIRHNG